MIDQTILKYIQPATSENPITSTRLIELVQVEIGELTNARSVRKAVERLRKKNKLPILATRQGKQGYFFCRTKAEFDQYEKEIRNHALTELGTLAEIRMNFFGESQQRFEFV